MLCLCVMCREIEKGDLLWGFLCVPSETVTDAAPAAAITFLLVWKKNQSLYKLNKVWAFCFKLIYLYPASLPTHHILTQLIILTRFPSPYSHALSFFFYTFLFFKSIINFLPKFWKNITIRLITFITRCLTALFSIKYLLIVINTFVQFQIGKYVSLFYFSE